MSFKSLHHSLDVNVACIYGTDEALLIHHFQHWISVNFRMKRNIHEGNCWTYQTLDEIAAHFPYMTKTRVADLLDRLCTGKSRYSKKESIDFDPVLKKGNFNKSRYDRTVWYAFCDYPKWILGKPQMDEVETPNQDWVNPTPIPDNITNNTSSSSLTPLQGNPTSKKHRSKKTVAKATEEEVSFKSKKAKEVLTNLSADEKAHLQKVIDRQMSLDQSKFISESYKVKVVENFRSKSSEAKEKKEEHLSKEKEIEINKLRAKAVYEEFLKDPKKWIGKMSLEECSGNLWIENKGSAVILSPCQSTKSWHEEVDKWRVKHASQ